MAQDIDTGEGYESSGDHAKPVASPFDRSGLADFSSVLKAVRETGDAIMPILSRRTATFGKTHNAAPVSNGLANQLHLLGYTDEDIKVLTNGQKQRIIAGRVTRGSVAPRVNAAVARPPVAASPQGIQLSSPILILGLAVLIFLLK